MNYKDKENIFHKKERPATFVIQRFNKNESKEKSKTLFNSTVKIWTDLLSRKNYVPMEHLKDIVKDLELPASIIENLSSPTKESEDIISKLVYQYLTLKINKLNAWDNFYNIPELYGACDVAHVLDCELADDEDGVLTREAVAMYLSCLHKSPLSGVYTYIKLDLASKRLVNIDALQHYKYLVYLDLSSNCLTEVKVLSQLLYLQYLCLDSNTLGALLDYDTPQWFLTEVYYGHNLVTKIGDLTLFWSITILDLSHNNIKYINGLENLQFLRRLDLSHNNIQRLENLSNLNLVWLDLSHNDIVSYECDEEIGLHTLRQLEYLNVDENRMVSMKVFSGCTRLKELHACNNGFSALYEVPLCLWQLARLVTLDLRDNPLCGDTWYGQVVVNTLPLLYQLDGEVLDPVNVRTAKLAMRPDVSTVSSRRLLRLLYIQQLSRARVSPYVLPADTEHIPLVVLVGPEATGRGALARRMAERHSNIELAKQHTTSATHSPDEYKLVTRKNFDNMLLAGELLTCSSVTDGTCGLSREEASVGDSKMKIVIMDYVGALMLRQRGYQPYLILTLYSDKDAKQMKREDRKRAKDYRPTEEEETTLQVLVSDRIIVGGILQEIIRVAINDDECSPTPSLETREDEPLRCNDNKSCQCCYCRRKDRNEGDRRRILQGEQISSSILPTNSFDGSSEYNEWIRKQWATPNNFVPNVGEEYDYESIHRDCPGMFWDTIVMDNPNAAYKKLKTIIKNIISEQKNKKLFKIDFTVHNNTIFKKKMEKISLCLAPHRLF